MRKVVALPIAVSPFLLCLTGFVQENSSGWMTVGTAEMRGLGVCDFTIDNVRCVNMEGKPDASLDERILKMANRSNQQISLRFGRLNRFIAVEYTGAQAHPINFQLSPGGATVYWTDQSETSRIQMLQVDPDRATPQMKVIATVSGLPGPDSVQIPLANGAGGSGYTIGMIRPVPPEKKEPQNPNAAWGYNPYGGIVNLQASPNNQYKRWRIDLGFEKFPANVFAQYTILGANGDPIDYVDHDGIPISYLTYVEDQPIRREYNPYGPPNTPDRTHYAPAAVASSGIQTKGAETLLMNVDPSKGKFLRISYTTQAIREIGPFPLPPAAEATSP